MIPASVNPSTSASSTTTSLLFPLVEPASAEIADFNQLLGEFSQPPAMTALSAPELTLSVFTSNNATDVALASTQATPESLLSTLTQGAEMALQQPLSLMSQPTITQALEDTRIEPQVASVYQASKTSMSNTATAVSLSTLVEPVAEQIESALPKSTQIAQLQTSPLAGELVARDIAQHSDQMMMGHAYDGLPKIAQSNLAMNRAETAGNAMMADSASKNGLISAEIQNVSTVISKTNLGFVDPSVSQSQSQVSSQANTMTPQPIKPIVDNSLANPLGSSGDNESINEEWINKTRVSENNLDALLPVDDVSVMPLLRGQYHAHSAQVIATSPASVTMNAQVVSPSNQSIQTVQAVALSQQAIEIPLADISHLGDNQAVVFATTPVSSISVASMLKAPTNGVDLTSTSWMQGASVTSMAAQLNNTQSSTSQDHGQASAQEDRLLALSEAADMSDTESSGDEFSLAPASPLTTSSSPTSILAAPLSLRQPQWTQGVAQRVQVMLNQSMNQLEVRLDPLGLGPMKISLKLDEQQKAHVTLSAQHGLTRDMLENALPRLKELLAQENIELASATVNSGEEQSTNQQNGSRSSHKAASDLSDDAVNNAMNMTEPRSTDNRVDQYV